MCIYLCVCVYVYLCIYVHVLCMPIYMHLYVFKYVICTLACLGPHNILDGALCYTTLHVAYVAYGYASDAYVYVSVPSI